MNGIRNKNKMSKENMKYPNWNRIYENGFIYDAETAEKIKLKGQEVLKELLEQRLNQEDE